MINITAKPTWQWASKNSPTCLHGAWTGTAAAPVVKQALMSRSLDLAFSLNYRR